MDSSKILLYSLVNLFVLSIGYAQNNVGIGTNFPSARAVLHLEANGIQGVILPKINNAQMSTITTISSAERGLIVYNTDSSKHFFHNGIGWRPLGGSSAGNGSGWALGGNTLTAESKIGTITNIELPFIVGNSEKMRIKGNGYVGIGIDPTYPLSLAVTDANGFGFAHTNGTVTIATNTSSPLGITGGSIGTISTGHPFWIYAGANDPKQLILLPTGQVGIGLAKPSAKLHIVGDTLRADAQFRLKNGSQAQGNILVTDAQGVSEWRKGTKYTQLSKLDATSLGNVSTTYAQVVGDLKFDKKYTDTQIELVLTSNLSIGNYGTANIIYFELRVDGLPTTFGTGYTSIQASPTVPGNIVVMFPRLDAGSHTVSVWAKTNTGIASNAWVDYGGNGGRIMVKEVH